MDTSPAQIPREKKRVDCCVAKLQATKHTCGVESKANRP